MFHVKQTPIDEGSPPLWCAIDQRKTIGIDDVYRCSSNQFGAPLYRFSVYVNNELAVRFRKARLEVRKAAEKQEVRFVMVDTLLQLMRAELMRLAQYVDSFQQAGFSGTIFPGDQVETRIEVERRTAQVSEISQAQLTDRHTVSAVFYKRIGMTTYKLDSSCRSLMMALLLESLSLICTFSEPSTFNTSIK